MSLPFHDLIPFPDDDDDDEDEYDDSESDDNLDDYSDDDDDDDDFAPLDKAADGEIEASDKATQVQIEGDFR